MPDRPPILFLHGAFAGPEIWTRFVAPWFAGRGHQVAVPRLPGPVPGGARFRDHVRRARAALGPLGPGAVVVGHSLGGLVAQHLAAERCVAGAVLVASPGPWGIAPTLWHLSARAPDVLASILMTQAGGGALLGVEAVRRALFTDETPAEWIADVMPVPEPVSPQALLDALTWDLPAWPFARAIPTLALLGDRDSMVPVTDLWALALHYGAETELIPGRGHGLPIDPSWKSLAWRINAWLDERAIGRGQRTRLTA